MKSRSLSASGRRPTSPYSTDKKTQGVYATYNFDNAGWLKPDSPLEKLAIEMFEAWKDREAKIDVETANVEDVDFDPSKLENQGQTVDAGM